jgi:hypothetical protein
VFGERKRLSALLAEERARSERLLELLMAVQAPQPYAAYMDTSPPKTDPTRWLFSEDGLSQIELDPEDL